MRLVGGMVASHISDRGHLEKPLCDGCFSLGSATNQLEESLSLTTSNDHWRLVEVANKGAQLLLNDCLSSLPILQPFSLICWSIVSYCLVCSLFSKGTKRNQCSLLWLDVVYW